MGWNPVIGGPGLYKTETVGAAPTGLTLDTNGEITVSGSQWIRFHTVDTFGGAASDDLDKINGGNPGEILILSAENDARTVVVKDGANIELQADFSLDDGDDSIALICTATDTWREISRSSSG